MAYGREGGRKLKGRRQNHNAKCKNAPAGGGEEISGSVDQGTKGPEGRQGIADFELPIADLGCLMRDAGHSRG